MERILSLANTKAAVAPSSNDASETPIATSSAEQFQTVMERMAGNWNRSASSNKTSILHPAPLGARSSKNSDNRKSGQSKTQTQDSKSSHQASQPAGDPTTASNSPNHFFMPADNPAFLPGNSLGIEASTVSIKTPATPATASPTKTRTTAKIGKVGELTNSTPKAGIKSAALPANVPAGLPSAKLSAISEMKAAFANTKLQQASAATEVETSTLQTAGHSDATSTLITDKSAVLSKSLRTAGIQIHSDAPIAFLPSGKKPVGMNSISSAQQPIVAENEVETSTSQTAGHSDVARIPTTGKSAALSKSLQPTGIQIPLDTPIASRPSGKEPVSVNSTPSAQPPIVAEEIQPLALPAQKLASTGSAATTAVPSTIDVFELGIKPPVPALAKLSSTTISETVVEPIAQVAAEKKTSAGQTVAPASQVPDKPSTGKISPPKGDGRTGSTPSVSGIVGAKTANSHTTPVLSAQIPSSPAGKNLPPGQMMPVPTATAETGGQNSAAPIPTAHAISESMGHSSTPPVSMPSAPPAGTTVAQQQMPMKMDAKQNEIAGAVEQKLPGKPVLPSPSGSSPAPLAGQPQDSGTSAMSATVATSNATAEVNSASVANSSPIFTSPVHTIQRTQDLMAMQIIQMHETGTDSLRVVIKPDAGLQLSLQLQQHNGGIEVQARVDRGDYNLLNQHWPELQQQFESRGIRVAPLSNGETFFGGGGEGFRQPSHSSGQFSDEEAFPAMSGALSPGYPPTATAKSASASATLSRRWETWA